MESKKTANILGALAIVLADDLRGRVNEALGVTGETAAALILLGANPDLTIRQIATALDITHSGAVRLVDRLTADSFTERSTGQDSRTVLVRLTAAGAKRRLTALAKRENVLSQAMALLEPKEVENFSASIERMLRGLLSRKEHGYRFCRMCDEGQCVPTGCPVDLRLEELVG